MLLLRKVSCHIACKVYLLCVVQNFRCGDHGFGRGIWYATEVVAVAHCTVPSERADVSCGGRFVAL